MSTVSLLYRKRRALYLPYLPMWDAQENVAIRGRCHDIGIQKFYEIYSEPGVNINEVQTEERASNLMLFVRLEKQQ